MAHAPLDVTVVAAQLCARVPGGTGRYTSGLLDALAVTRPPGWSLRMVLAHPCPGAGAVNRVPQRSLHVPVPVLARLWERGLPPRVRGTVVHAPTLLVPPVPQSGRLVVTIHDSVPWTHPETLTSRGVRFHHRMAARAAAAAALIVTPTEAVASQVRDLLSPSGEVVAIAPGVGSLRVPGDAADMRRAAGVPDRYVLFVGTSEPRKGLDVLLPAMSHPGLADMSLVVAGPPGWGSVDVHELSRRAGVDGRVVVTGQVSDHLLAALFTGAAVLAVPSRAEGFGLPVLEGMALGVPVVTSDDPALVEVGGGAASVVPVGSVDALAAALARVVSSAEESDRMRAAGGVRAGSFSWERSAAQLWARYAALD